MATVVSKNELLDAVEAYSKQYMAQYDSSHDFSHVQRVRKTALFVGRKELNTWPQLDLFAVEIAALLHDVGDHKYRKDGDPPAAELIVHVLQNCGAPAELAVKVAAIIEHISFTKELKMDKEEYSRMLGMFPEIRIVQDADRLDAIGAIGIGRTFAFSAAKNRKMYGEAGSTLSHFDEKLLKLEGMMKTETGKKLARVRTDRLEIFKSWMLDEINGLE